MIVAGQGQVSPGQALAVPGRPVRLGLPHELRKLAQADRDDEGRGLRQIVRRSRFQASYSQSVCSLGG